MEDMQAQKQSSASDIGRAKTTPKDFFLYLATAVTLYVSAGSLLALLFGIINFSVVDPAAGSFYYGGYSGGVRFAIASLIVLFPLFLLLAWYARKDAVLHPEKLRLWVRTWFIYITIFVTGATVVGDLVAVLNSFLGGELTLRFLLKVCAVFIVAGVVFGYYLYDLRRSGEGGRGARVVFLWGAIVVVLASLVGGFAVMGSPLAQREYRLDEERVSDLSRIQSEVVSFWRSKGVLPQALSDLEDGLRGFEIPEDPVTNMQYSYMVAGDLSFELCAVFDREGRSELLGRGPYPVYEESPGALSEGANWKHDSGRVCFERTIDPDFFPPRTVAPEKF